MITPVFEIGQTDESLLFKIRAPYAKLSELEVEFTDQLFLFSCAPYYLRVHLPRQVQDDEGNNSTYDVDSGLFTITVPKMVKGEFFEDLDMISELLRPQTAPSAQRPVEELEDDDEEEEALAGECYQEQHPQDISSGVKDEEANLYGYGFGWRRTGVFEQLREQIGKLIDLEEPEMVPLAERAQACVEYDCNKFDCERYLMDNLQPDPELQTIINANFEANLELTEDNRTKLKDLPNRKVSKLSTVDEASTLYSLVDLVFAWAYDQRVNGWEGSCESGWTISHLSATLSFLIKWETLQQACIGSVRRSLCYPLYRNWDLALKVLQDTVSIFQQGKSALVHVVGEIHAAMINSSEFRYLHNDVLLTDLLLWLQALPASRIGDIAVELALVSVGKDQMELDLEEAELNGRVLLMAIDNRGLDSDDDCMSRHLYKQYLRLISKWPKDPFKHPDRDLPTFLAKEVERQFAPSTSTTVDPALCERRLQALDDLCSNKVLGQYPHTYKSGVFGLPLQQLQEMSTEENRDHFGLTPKKNIFRQVWSLVAPAKKNP